MNKQRLLSSFDATLLVSGSMVGSGIFIVSASMARDCGGPGWLLLLWILAGVITLCGALSYGELAGMMPHAGGPFVYLKRSFNPLVAFLYGWALFAVIQSGTIAAVAMAFAKFLAVFIPGWSEHTIILVAGPFSVNAAQIVAMCSIILLTWINSRGIHYSKIIIRVFNSSKILALAALILFGLFAFNDKSAWHINMAHFWLLPASVTSWCSVGFAMIMGGALVGSLFSSDAWNNVTFIAGEIDNPARTIPRALFWGTLIVTALYLAANLSYLHLLPFWGNAHATGVQARGIQYALNDRVGTAAAEVLFKNTGIYIMAALILISTFGCNNGIILSSSRLYQTMSADNVFFPAFKHNNKNNVPGNALWGQCIWCCVLCLSGQYGTLLNYVMFAVMLFYIITIAGIFVLRIKEPAAPRPYKAWGYPIIPLLYIILAFLFCVNLLFVQPASTWPGLIIVVLGIPVYYVFTNLPKSTRN